MSDAEKLDAIGLRYTSVTLIRWKHEPQHWRGGLDWSNDDFEFIVEKPTISEVIDALYKYAEENA